MTTYNTYQEAKMNNVDSEVFTKDGVFLSESALLKSPYNYEYGGFYKCNPADYCMTVEKFLADGHKFVKGDALLDVFGGLIVVGSDYSVLGANIKLDTDDRRYILRAAALEEKEESELIVISDNDLIENLFDGFNRITAESEYQDAYDIACEMLEFESERANLKKDKPRTKVEYVKVTDSIFDLRPDFEAGELFSKVNHARDYSTINNTQTLAQALHQSCCYRRIETPMTEREEFIKELEIIASDITSDGEWSFACIASSMYDSGKFKLVS